MGIERDFYQQSRSGDRAGELCAGWLRQRAQVNALEAPIETRGKVPRAECSEAPFRVSTQKQQ
jgi:hypothetical protein